MLGAIWFVLVLCFEFIGVLVTDVTQKDKDQDHVAPLGLDNGCGYVATNSSLLSELCQFALCPTSSRGL